MDAEQFVWLAIGEYLNLDIADLFGRNFVVPENEAGDSQRLIRFPGSDQLISFSTLAGLIARRRQAIFLGIVKGQVKTGSERKALDSQFVGEQQWIPAKALAEIIAAAHFDDHALAAILKLYNLVVFCLRSARPKPPPRSPRTIGDGPCAL